MKNLRTEIEKTTTLKTIRKSFDAKTPKGLDIVITVWRQVYYVTSRPHKTKNYFEVAFNGQSQGHYKMNRDALGYFIGFIDKYANQL